jgi:hypothetical protein
MSAAPEASASRMAVMNSWGAGFCVSICTLVPVNASKLRTLPALEPHSIKLLVKRGYCESYYTAPFRKVSVEQKNISGEKIWKTPAFESHFIELLVTRGDCKPYYTAPFLGVTQRSEKIRGKRASPYRENKIKKRTKK